MKWLELRVPPLVVLAVAVAVAWIVAGRPVSVTLLAAAFGGTLAALGIVICLVAVGQFRGAGTTVDPRHPDKSRQIVSTGLYSRTRNPMYLGFVLILAGIVAALGNVWAGLALPAFTEYITRFQIVPEEALLRARFGRDFDAYAARVRRWI